MAEQKKKKRKAAAPKEETPEQRTKRLTDFRVSKSVKVISQVANLGGVNYTLTDKQKEEILKALNKAVSGVEKAFTGSTIQANGFSLSG